MLDADCGGDARFFVAPSAAANDKQRESCQLFCGDANYSPKASIASDSLLMAKNCSFHGMCLHFLAASLRSVTTLSRERCLFVCPLRDDPLELESDDEPLSDALESDEPTFEYRRIKLVNFDRTNVVNVHLFYLNQMS